MLATLGGLFNGWALYLDDRGVPVFHYNFANIAHSRIAASESLPAGDHVVAFDFVYDGGGIGKGGTGTLTVNGKQAATGRIEHTVANRFTMSVETFDIGEDTGTPVNLDYDVPYKFTGTIDHITIDVHPRDEHTAAAVAATQAKNTIEQAMRE
jgi:hypothetical protein